MMSRSAGGSCAGSTEPEVEGEVEGVGEAEDLAVRRWKETGEETVRRWGLDRRGLERRAEETRRRGVEVAAADAYKSYRLQHCLSYFRCKSLPGTCRCSAGLHTLIQFMR